MRSLIINQKSFYVLNYKGQVEILDDEGFKTGETTVSYSKPKKVSANVSGARGSSQIEMFGTEINYDKTIVMSKKYFDSLKIDENSVFFIDAQIKYDSDNIPLYNYRITRIAETLNEVAIAVKKVRAN